MKFLICENKDFYLYNSKFLKIIICTNNDSDYIRYISRFFYFFDILK